jgi:serine/threonine protein kinase
MKCPACAHDLPDGAAFCPACAAPVDFTSTPTVTRVESPRDPANPISPPRPPSAQPRPPASHSSNFGYEARYVPGSTLLDRYRIVSPLGKGGMGEVYRAEDLKLGQTVALKFLPKSLSRNEEALARFVREVRIARQVSHPNVCRVFDIGEADGQTFLTMEFVDGEDMSSLIRRIGRLPADKALEIARQVCAGLAAAHEHGIIHRDLKPANIMLDGRGRARITDFGLAGLATEMHGEDARAGTPAYMSPEQFAGGEVTAKSDLYALGLVMYEIFTGKKPYEAATYDEMARLREKSAPTAPSTHLKDIDPLVERVMLRCLEKNPDKRPASALQIAAALPGGDPLAAALAAGETPSPELVAASGEKAGLRPAIAWSCLLLIILGVTFTVLLAPKTQLLDRIPPPSTPDVLAAKGRDFAREFGYPTAPVDTAFSFDVDSDYLDYLRAGDRSATPWNNFSSGVPPSVIFWYRESPQFMIGDSFALGRGVGVDIPPNSTSGMCQILLDTQGRLLKFEAIPPQRDTSTELRPPPDWNALFTAAALDMNQFKTTSPQWTPLAIADSRAAWEGSWPGRAELPLRVEAAAFRGKIVYFSLVSPWTIPDRMEEQKRSTGDSVETGIFLVLLLGIVVIGIVMARRNILSGRGDSRSAARLAAAAFLSMCVAILVDFAHHVPTSSEFVIVMIATAWGLVFAAISWLLYVAIEPHVRRRWPDSLISWSRLLAGQFRDPVVGRDLLVGILVGVCLRALQTLRLLALNRISGTNEIARAGVDYSGLLGARYVMGGILLNVALYAAFSLSWFVIFFLFRLVLRKEWAAALLMILLSSFPAILGPHPIFDTITNVIYWIILLLLLTRFGLLALMMALLAESTLRWFPLTSHLSAWYAQPTILVCFLILAAALFGFYTSTKGRSLFGGLSLDT